MITALHQVFGRKATVKNEGLILDLPLQNSFVDVTGKNTMVAGGTSNLPTFTLEGGEYAATFNGSQSLKTNANFNVGTDKVSISFWLKTSQTVGAAILELSNNYNYYNAFVAVVNELHPNKIYIGDHTTAYNIGYSSVNINDNNWHHIVITIDRSQNELNQNRIYVDGNLAYNQNVSFKNDLNGLFANLPLFIGKRGAYPGFNGQLKFLKIFNYPLSQTEITNLYNKTM